MRGIYPPVLADRGLGDAIRALALDTPLRTVLDIDLPEPVDMLVASAVYFSVAEALTNVAKHAGRTFGPNTAHATLAGMLRPGGPPTAARKLRVGAQLPSPAAGLARLSTGTRAFDGSRRG